MRRPAFLGLRSRVVLSLLATSAVTVGVVAVTLLSPLERHLRGDELESLHQAALVVRPLLSHVPENALRPGSAKLDHAVKTAAGRVDAQIVMVAMSGACSPRPSRDPATAPPRPLARLASTAPCTRSARRASRPRRPTPLRPPSASSTWASP
jgi:hypothetical protein